MSEHPGLTTTVDGAVTLLRLDDGKANALTFELIDAVRRELDAAFDRGGAVVLAGRAGRFSGGFDLSIMQAGVDQARSLLQAGAELGLALLEAPVPTVVACTGHAIAMGAILLLCADERVGPIGPAKIGMTEVAIGMPLPRFAIALAEQRLSPRALTAAVNLATVYDGPRAVAAGYLDLLADPDEVVDVACSRAAELAAGLNPKAFAMTRTLLQGPRADRVRAGIAADIETFEILAG